MKRIVIYRLGSLGDTVVALPCFNRIVSTFPDYRRIVLTNVPVSSNAAPMGAVLGDMIDEVIAYPVGTRDPRKLLGIIATLRALQPAQLVYLMPSRGLPVVVRDAAFFRLCGFKEILGLPLSRDLINNRVDPATGLMERECQRLARCLSELGPIDPSDPAQWHLHLTAEEVGVAREMLAPFAGRPFIAINMGGKQIQNDWGTGNWSRLLAATAARWPDHGLLIVGSAEDTERGRSLTADLPCPVIDACGTLTPRQSAAALREARLFVGHDSGPMHLASAVGTSCVGLFGNLNPPGKWHPLIGNNRLIHDMRGVQAIAVETVTQAIDDIMMHDGSE